MAERRMFSQKIVESDAFTDMPLSAQALYFHLNMNADDDGFVNSPKKVARSVGASEKDLKTLIEKRFLIAFPSRVVVIKHWLMHNYIRPDRYKKTEYQEEFSQLYIKPNKAYTENPEHANGEKPQNSAKNQASFGSETDANGLPNDNQMPTKCLPNVYQMDPQDRIGEDRGKDRIDKNREKGAKNSKNKDFTPPTLEEIKEFCAQRESPVDPNRFYDFFEAGNWIDTKGNPVKNWKQKLITWERKEKTTNGREPAAGKPVSGTVSGNTPRSRWGPSKYEYD